MTAPERAPSLHIPPSNVAVKVFIIDTTTHISGLPSDSFVQPHIEGYDVLDCPALAFLIEHPSGKRVLFDLGVRRDWENLSPRIQGLIKKGGWHVTVEKGVAEILIENAVPLESIDAIIWR